MKECPKCKSEHEKPGKFCSRSCANSRVWSEETQKKRSNSIRKFWNNMNEKERKSFTTHIQRNLPGKEYYINKLFERDFNSLCWDSKRKVIIIEQNECCDECGIDSWRKNPLTLEIDHVNGNKKDNSRENLRGLCPNCHSQTLTWRGRNNLYTSVV